MSLISDLLPLSNIVIDLETSGKKRLFEEASELFAQNQQLDESLIFDSLFARERLGSTGLGQGVAIPHGRIKGLELAAGAFIRLATPIQFNAPDGRPVSIVFVLLVPEQANETHLQLLSTLAQMFNSADFRDALLNAPDAQSIHALFADWEDDA